ncbi:MAG: site-2 protease family protein [Anaerolineae bacterium]|nr:MAG: site-2 protease family protein [Anaerolineae bacterium]
MLTLDESRAVTGGKAETATAQISKEPRSARAEFLMALAGPTTGLIIAALFGLLWLVSLSVNSPVHALAGWMAWINVGLTLFNMIPGFPLDGGRVFRATVWAVTGNLRRAAPWSAHPALYQKGASRAMGHHPRRGGDDPPRSAQVGRAGRRLEGGL